MCLLSILIGTGHLCPHLASIPLPMAPETPLLRGRSSRVAVLHLLLSLRLWAEGLELQELQACAAATSLLRGHLDPESPSGTH